jgi:A/G-specific adenine glycosylase
MVQELPVKSKAKASRTRYFHYMVLRYEDTVYLRKRTDKDIWQGLYDFALTESDSPDLPPTDLVDKVEDLGGKLDTNTAEEPAYAARHVLSHQKVEARFHAVRLQGPLPAAALAASGLAPFTRAEIEQLPKAVLISNYLERIGF